MINSSFVTPKKVAKRKTSDYAESLFQQQKQVLAQTLVKARIDQGLSQEALAYEAQVERSYVSLIERGNGNPSLRVLCQLAYRLGVDLVELLGVQLATAKLQAPAVKTPKIGRIRLDMNVSIKKNLVTGTQVQVTPTPPTAPKSPLDMWIVDSPPRVINNPKAEKPQTRAPSSRKSSPKTKRY